MDLLFQSTISSVLNAAAGQVWDDLIKPYWEITDSKATIVTKVIGEQTSFYCDAAPVDVTLHP